MCIIAWTSCAPLEIAQESFESRTEESSCCDVIVFQLVKCHRVRLVIDDWGDKNCDI